MRNMSITKTKEQIAATPDDSVMTVKGYLGAYQLPTADFKALADSHTKLLEAAKAIIEEGYADHEIVPFCETLLRPLIEEAEA